MLADRSAISIANSETGQSEEEALANQVPFRSQDA
jgi:hypothetical protein